MGATLKSQGVWGCSLGGGRSTKALGGRQPGEFVSRTSPLPPPFLARNCMRLQVLELDHVSEITQEVAAEVCREGLKGLEMLVLTATPVTPKALLHFNSERWECRRGATTVTTYCATSASSIASSLSVAPSQQASTGGRPTGTLILALPQVSSAGSVAFKSCQHLVQTVRFNIYCPMLYVRWRHELYNAICPT